VFKRLIWWAAGAAMGTVGSRWAERKVRRTVAQKVDRYRPPAVAAKVKDSAIDRTVTVIDGVRGAVQTGRQAAADREVELRNRYRTSGTAGAGAGEYRSEPQEAPGGQR
jgi:hypothetical protein